MRNIIITIITLLLILTACTTAVEMPPYTEEESQIIAEDHVKSHQLYIDNNGKYLSLATTIEMDCESCWTFVYQFDIGSDEVSNVIGYQVDIGVVEGVVKYTRITEVQGVEITSFEECIEAGYPAMESYPRQCAIPGGDTFTEIIN